MEWWIEWDGGIMDYSVMIRRHKDKKGYFVLSYVYRGERVMIDMHFQKALDAYNGLADDIVEWVPGSGVRGREKKGYNSLAEYMERVMSKWGDDDKGIGRIIREYELTPTVMRRVMSRGCRREMLERGGESELERGGGGWVSCGCKWMKLKRRKGGWGGYRVSAGAKVGGVRSSGVDEKVNMWRKRCIEKAARSGSLMPYKIFENVWESVYHRKANKKLFMDFAKEVSARQKVIGG